MTRQCIECWMRLPNHRPDCTEGQKVREQEERRRAKQAARYPNQGYGAPEGAVAVDDARPDPKRGVEEIHRILGEAGVSIDPEAVMRDLRGEE